MAEIPLLPECSAILVFGPPSSGKSHLMQTWISGLERSVTIDTTAECMDSSFTHVWGNPKELLTILFENPFYYRISYHPSGRNFEHDFKWCVEGLWLSGKINEGKNTPLPRWLFVDEVHEVCSNHSVLDEMDLIIRYCRHNLMGFVGCTHRLADVNRLLTSNAKMIILFHTMEPVDLDAIQDRFGKDVRQQVINLRPLIYDDVHKSVEQEPQCLVWIRGKGTKVFSLGDKIKTGEINLWENSSKDVPKTPEQPSLEHSSGNPEPKLQEPLLKNGNPQ